MAQALYHDGRKRLMLRLPRIRPLLQHMRSPALEDICECYELAVVARDRFSRRGGSELIAAEYQQICADLESEVEAELRMHFASNDLVQHERRLRR